jgi:hypothetical protein
VSFPSNVVKSTIVTANRNPNTFAFFFTLRDPYFATRSSIPTASTVPMSSNKRRKLGGDLATSMTTWVDYKQTIGIYQISNFQSSTPSSLGRV